MTWATTSMIFPSTCMKARSWALRACWARAVPSCWKRLFGARTRESGTVTLKGKEIRNKSTAEAIKNGFALCTEERRFNGIFPDLGLDFNTAIAGIGNYTNKVGWLSTKKMTDGHPEDDSTPCTPRRPSTKTKIRHLSGGNQQKVILGRWLLLNPDIFLLDDPTRGIDVGAKYEIYQLIFDLAKQNKGVIICSSEMPELLGICDRVLVLSSGHLTGEYDLVHDREHATQENNHGGCHQVRLIIGGNFNAEIQKN